MAAIEFDHVTKRFPDGTVAVDDIELTVADGEFMIFVGPSGCGKTTALRMVAGLEEITSGEIRIGGRVVNDLEPPDRDIAMVFQNYALYPHMSVADNIGFRSGCSGSRSRRRTIAFARSPCCSASTIFSSASRASSRAASARVAMGRAIIRHPQAFLMDEPLSNLDAKLRVQMRAELVKLHHRLDVTTIYVTHDQTEAMTLGQRVAVLDKGVIQQVDTPQGLYRRPTNTFVASFIGSPAMNFIRGRLADRRVELGDYAIELADELRRSLRRDAGDVLVGLRPGVRGCAPPPGRVADDRAGRDRGHRAARAGDLRLLSRRGPRCGRDRRPAGRVGRSAVGAPRPPDERRARRASTWRSTRAGCTSSTSRRRVPDRQVTTR